MRNRILLSLLCTFITTSVSAGIIASFGGTSDVQEVDIREVIYKRLHFLEKTGELEKYQKKAADRVKEQIQRPEPLNFKTTTTPEIFYVDPSIKLNQDVFDSNGRLIAKKGTVINPFEKINLNKALIFFDADDEKQVAWVKQEYSKYRQVKFILTGGSVKDASELFGRVYFDWKGAISRKLQIKHVPSVATQKGLQWEIREGGIL